MVVCCKIAWDYYDMEGLVDYVSSWQHVAQPLIGKQSTPDYTTFMAFVSKMLVIGVHWNTDRSNGCCQACHTCSCHRYCSNESQLPAVSQYMQICSILYGPDMPGLILGSILTEGAVVYDAFAGHFKSLHGSPGVTCQARSMYKEQRLASDHEVFGAHTDLQICICSRRLSTQCCPSAAHSSFLEVKHMLASPMRR